MSKKKFARNLMKKIAKQPKALKNLRLLYYCSNEVIIHKAAKRTAKIIAITLYINNFLHIELNQTLHLKMLLHFI